MWIINMCFELANLISCFVMYKVVFSLLQIYMVI